MTATEAPPEVRFTDSDLSVRFDRFHIPAYELFLKVKRLPESRVTFDVDDESYTVSAPARFAELLGVERPARRGDALPLSPFLFDDQKEIVRLALEAKRFACWSDCGLGKTLIGLEVGRQVVHRTGGKGLITTLNDIVPEWIDQQTRFYGDTLPLERLTSRAQMKAWCADAPSGLAITNYEKWNPGKLEEQVVSEARRLALIIVDENRLKTGGGKQKWALIKSCKGIEYKLSLTATPAPNDVMEFASQASFLEKMRSQEEILWTYFTRDPKTHRWTVRPHARAAFFEFMASWSIYVRDPRRYGWRLDLPEVPKPDVIVHELPITEPQREHLRELSAEPSGQHTFFDRADTNAIQRVKLSQVAKGFRYRRRAGSRIVQPVESIKPAFVVDLVRQEVADGRQVLVWTEFDAESDLLMRLLEGVVSARCLTGATSDAQRADHMTRFRAGEFSTLVSRARMIGWGVNLQNVGAMIFSGWCDSYESYYQALRRAYRFGQTQRLRVHLPVIAELEGDMLENIFRKHAEHEASIAEMEANYLRARGALGAGIITGRAS